MNFINECDRIYLEDTDKKILAEINFPKTDDNTVCINHTFVDDSLRGQGVAGKLMDAVIEHLKMNNLTATATCSYAMGWFEKHPEYNNLYKK